MGFASRTPGGNIRFSGLRKKAGLLLAVVIALLGFCLLAGSAESQSPPEGSSPHSSDNAPADNTLQEKGALQGSASGKTRESEVVGFRLIGSKPMIDKLSISDMGILRTDGKRFLPLLRMLNVLGLKMTPKGLEPPGPERAAEGRILRFHPDGCPEVTLDLSSRRMEIEGKATPVEVVEEVSVLTHEPEIFLPQEVIAGIFSMEITWNEQEYEFTALTNLPLGIWKFKKRTGLPVQEAPTNLPELLPPASPRKTGLDLMEVRGRARVSWENQYHLTQGALESLQQTFRGNLIGAPYKLRFSEPDIVVGANAPGLYGRSPVSLDWGEWVHRSPNYEVSLGDSAFGLDELTFPFMRITGIRSNGISGPPEEKGGSYRTSRGFENFFVQPQVFEGFAPRGSKAELVINDRIIDTQQAFSDRGTPTGVGRYRFEDIILPPGRLSEVLINITDTNGIVTHIRKYVQGSNQLLPEGRFAYMGGAGTNRDTTYWRTRGIFSGGKMLYGVSDRFTIGGVLGTQKSYYKPMTLDSFDPDLRQVPKTSYHLGGQLIWQPIPQALLSGDVSFSKIMDDPTRGGIKDVAYKAKGVFYPTTNMELNSQFFFFGPDFFDGNNTRLHDREGYVFNGKWQVFPKWSMTGAYGEVRNNVRRDAMDNTVLAKFQNLEVVTGAIPRMNASAGFHRLSSNTGEDTKTLPYFRFSATPLRELYVDGSISGGKSPALLARPEFFSGLNVPGLALFEQPTRTATLRKGLNDRNSLGFTYWESGENRRVTAIHTFRSSSEKPLGIRTEAGYDYRNDVRTPYLENRTEYQLDRYRNKTLELLTRLSLEQWEVSLSFNFNELFSFPRWSPTRVTGHMINPEIGGVHGKVFLDYNANGRMDPGEPGVEDVKVVAGIYSAVTDKDGYFVLPVLGHSEMVRVFIDLNSVPAIYLITHGIQTVYLQEGNLTEVNFGVTPGISLTGLVTWSDSKNTEKPLPGVRVFVTDAAGKEFGTDSVTAGDGTYYIGNLKPGKFIVNVDPKSVPDGYLVSDPVRAIEISPAKEPQELTLPPFQATQR
jgi:hypothetical protein